LGEELERDRRGRLEVQQRVEQLNQERLRLERELSRSKESSSSGRPMGTPLVAQAHRRRRAACRLTHSMVYFVVSSPQPLQPLAQRF
jgi:hypothetical protein